MVEASSCSLGGREDEGVGVEAKDHSAAIALPNRAYGGLGGKPFWLALLCG